MSSADASPSISTKVSRLIRWNVECLSHLLKQIEARRQVAAVSSQAIVNEHNIIIDRKDGKTVLDEVQDYIVLPEIDLNAAKKVVNPNSIELDDDVIFQLHDYVQSLAAMYNNNNFHNFEVRYSTMCLSFEQRESDFKPHRFSHIKCPLITACFTRHNVNIQIIVSNRRAF